MTDFESWEEHYDLHSRRDYEALVAYCEAEVKRHPDDLHAAERLAEAYLLNANYDKALEFVTQIHRAHPDISSFQHSILDALFALGKSENEFDWSIRPTVVRLAPRVCDRCFDFLRSKRKPRSLHELRWELGRGAYLAFTDDELFEYLKRDSRFVIEGEDAFTAKIKVSRSAKSRTTG